MAHAPVSPSRIVEITAEELVWPFMARNGLPMVVDDSGDYQRQFEVSPFPCYPHDIDVVEATIRACERAFPVGMPPTVYTLHFDVPNGVNGWTSHAPDFRGGYEDSQKRPEITSIVLAGKRTPIHPAMTRYLVAHEYGHVVERWLAFRRGQRQDDAFLRDYCEWRRLPYRSDRASGGTWHLAPCEVFADDFRILVAGIEVEFWPHPGVERPERKSLTDWWWSMRDKCAAKEGRAS